MAFKEYRFSGVGTAGQAVQGTVFAPSKRTAQKKVSKLSDEHGFRLRRLLQRRTFVYKVRHPNGKEVTGEQKAYSSDEIETALRKMGLEVVFVRKKFLAVQRKPPSTDIIMFVRLASNLIKDKLPFERT